MSQISNLRSSLTIGHLNAGFWLADLLSAIHSNFLTNCWPTYLLTARARLVDLFTDSKRPIGRPIYRQQASDWPTYLLTASARPIDWKQAPYWLTYFLTSEGSWYARASSLMRSAVGSHLWRSRRRPVGEHGQRAVHRLYVQLRPTTTTIIINTHKQIKKE